MSAYGHFPLCRTLALAALCTAVGACANVPLPKSPTRDLPAHWRNAAPQAGAKTDLTGWWKRFADPQLDALVDAALQDNLDVQQAVLKLRAARALARAASGTFKPQVGFSTREQPNPENTASYFQAGFDASWELGLFGRGEATARLAAASTGEAAVALQSARVTLVAEVVRQYLELRAAQRRGTLLAAAARSADRKLALLRIRQRLQLATALQVEQAAAAAATAHAEAAEPGAAIAQHAQALAVLTGRGEPQRDWLASRPLPEPGPGSVASVPADLLRTRPEIRYAQTQVLKAAGDLGIAKADLYPRLALGSSLTFAAPVKDQVRLGAVNSTFGIGPLIDIPLFDWGRRRAVRDARADDLRAAVLAWRQAVLQGAAEVETDLAALHAATLRAHAAVAAAQASQRALRLDEKLRDLEMADELDLADAQLALGESQLACEQARLARGLAFVALYKALGGAPLPSAGPAQDAPAAAESIGQR